MATIRNCVIVSKISGTLYGMVFKQYRKGAVISKIPDMSNVQPSEKQKAGNKHFAEAVAVVRNALRDPEKKKELTERFKAKARSSRSSIYHVALSTYLRTGTLT